MPELPEIFNRAAEMKKELSGKTIAVIEILQPKCLNISKAAFSRALKGARIQDVTFHGKWIYVLTSQGRLLLNLGMGGEILLVTRNTLPAKQRLIFDFSDQTCLSVNFWWFGYAHYVPDHKSGTHDMTARLGVNANELTSKELKKLLDGRRGMLKPFLLNQANIAGIGNAYIHDILFLAGLHPMRTINTLSDKEINRLAKAIHNGLQPAIDKGGAFYEVNLLGQNGGFSKEDILIGYREEMPCPDCGTGIEKIKTGGTSSFICPNCQPLK
jgi:formamidopyrimidine-DNA glycosylase